MSGHPPGLTRTIAIWGGIEEKVRSGYYDNMLKGGKIVDDPIDESGDDSSADATPPPAITSKQKEAVKKFLRKKKKRPKKPEA